MSFKEDYIPLKDSPKRMEYSLFLKLEKDKIAQMLIHSLVFDGRFYGAEWEEYDVIAEMAGMFSHLVNHPFDAVKAVREMRDQYLYED